MKKIILLCLVIFAGFQMQAQNNLVFTGYVNNPAGGVANHLVYLRVDSLPNTLGYIIDSTFTNANGYYTFNTQLPANTFGGMGYVNTRDCNGSLVYHYFSFWQPNPVLSHNFLICNTNICVAQFSFGTNPNTPPLSITFSSTSQPSNATHQWMFGDGTANNQNIRNVTKTYSNPGTYNVCLIISTTNCSDTICQTVVVNQTSTNCTANFTAYPDSINPQTIFFQNTSPNIGTQTLFTWHFGDGTTSTQQSPVKTYATPGSFQVVLVRTEPSCSDTTFSQITVGNAGACNASFYHHPALITVPNAITFVSTSQPSNATHIWIYGDGKRDTLFTTQTTHIYSQPGTYNACLIISAQNCIDTICQTIVVNQSGSNCTASYSAYPDSLNPQMIYFQNTSPNINTQTSFIWHFGDGTTSSQQSPIKTYATAGTYTVILVRLEPNCVDSFFSSITIQGGSTNNPWFKGTVYLPGTTINTHPFAVYLFLQDTLTGNITPVDTFMSSQTTINPAYNYEFVGPYQAGSYILLAELLQGHNLQSQYMPTYYGNVQAWSSASTIYTTTAVNSFLNIGLQHIGSNSGSARISGYIWNGPPAIGTLFGYGKARIMLSDLQGNARGHAISATNGTFSINNLAFGDYLIWVEIPGKVSAQATITLNGNNPRFDSLQFYVQTNAIVLNTQQLNNVLNLKLFPNPVIDLLNINLTCTNSRAIYASIYDATGKLVNKQQLNKSGFCNELNTIDVSTLQTGIYFLHLTVDEKQTSLKFIKK